MKRKLLRWGVVGLLAGAVTAAFAGTAEPGSSGEASLEVMVSGLDNARGITIGHFPRGSRILVAEAGKGGERCEDFELDGETTTKCFGRTGAITRVFRGDQNRVGPRLPSIAVEDGSFVDAGPHDVAVRDRRVFAVLGDGLDIFPGLPSPREAFGPGARLFGKLVRLQDGEWKVVANLAAYEKRHNPDGGVVESNAYGLLALSKWRQVVADAAGNDLLMVRRGEISTIAVFPSQLADAPPFLGLPPGTQIPAESVPTSVARGPDGAYYVGELTGFPFPVDQARVWRVERGEDPEVFATGFTAIIDIAFGRDGSLYVLEFTKNGLLAAEQGGDPTGALIRIAPDGTRTEIASEGLVFPGGLAVRGNGTVLVTNLAVFPGQGEVVRIRP
jgi:hypothetical protein